MSALRYNTGKPRFSLMSSAALTELAKVLTFGSVKYSCHNWRKGLSWSACVDSLLRHVHAWQQGEELDPESGVHHMAHVMCNAMFLVEFAITGGGVDDRYRQREVAEAAPTPKPMTLPTCGASDKGCNCVVNEELNARYRENVKTITESSRSRSENIPDVL